MDKLYCVLVTTKTSNILEDLETLRLFVRVINEYTSGNKSQSDEQAILDNAFTLLFAFDEIVALGYRENVNMSQVKTFVEMDSHEERVFEAVRQSQERDAKQKMREKAKELSRLQRTQQNERLRGSMAGSGNSIYSGNGSSSISSSYGDSGNSSQLSNNNKSNAISSYSERTAPKPKQPSRALKLGSKNQNTFDLAPAQLDTELKEEDQVVSAQTLSKNEPVHITIEEKLNVEISNDGAVRYSELTGVLFVLISQIQYAKIKFLLECSDGDVQVSVSL